MAQRIKRFGQLSGPGILDPQQLAIEAADRRHAAQLAHARRQAEAQMAFQQGESAAAREHDMAKLLESIFAQQEAAKERREYESGQAALGRTHDMDMVGARGAEARSTADYSYKLGAKERKAESDRADRKLALEERTTAATEGAYNLKLAEARAKLEAAKTPEARQAAEAELQTTLDNARAAKARADTAELAVEQAKAAKKAEEERKAALEAAGYSEGSRAVSEYEETEAKRNYAEFQRQGAIQEREDAATAQKGELVVAGLMALHAGMKDIFPDEKIDQLRNKQIYLTPEEHNSLRILAEDSLRAIDIQAVKFPRYKSEAKEEFKKELERIMESLKGGGGGSGPVRQAAASGAAAGGLAGPLFGPIAAAGGAVAGGIIGGGAAKIIEAGDSAFDWLGDAFNPERVKRPDPTDILRGLN